MQGVRDRAREVSQIHVFSTGFASPFKDRCLASTAGYRHTYVDAAEQYTPRGATENLQIVRSFDPSDVVVLLDGDDWLLPGALEKIEAWYEDPDVWVTYGQYRNVARGTVGHCREYTPAEWWDLRRADWQASHPKTFRAWLFQAVPVERFQWPSGAWVEHARDLLTMFPILELAGPEHTRFNPEPLYAYNDAASFAANAGPDDFEHEIACVNYVRGQAPMRQG